MKSVKKTSAVLSLLTVAAMLLTACGGAATPVPAATATSGGAAATPTTAEARTPAASGGVIKLVSSLPRTGLSKPQTDDIVAAYRMAIEERGGTVAGFEIVYEDWDDATAQAGKWDPATEQANATKAANDPDVMAYLGTFNSGAAVIAIPILNQAGLPMVSPANTAPACAAAGIRPFRSASS